MPRPVRVRLTNHHRKAADTSSDAIVNRAGRARLTPPRLQAAPVTPSICGNEILDLALGNSSGFQSTKSPGRS